jgi:uracil-DNA glycosylase family protein
MAPRTGTEPGAREYLPEHAGWEELRRAAARCRGCPLYREATRTVFGRGPLDAPLMMVGEQPGDQEDRRGEPFVGPAGHLLARATAEADLDPERIYVTNAVKHFKFHLAGNGPRKRRMHEAPSMGEVTACRPWLDEELRLVEPQVVVLLGATAGRALYGSGFRLGPRRGVLEQLPDRDGQSLATLHPSAVLRGGDDREQLFAGLVADLRTAGEACGG